MYVDLLDTYNQYFDRQGKEVDYDEEGIDGLVPYEQAQALQKILTCEVSIYLLRRNEGLCGSLVDDMISIRRKFIDEYEEKYEKYVEYNDFM